MMVAGGGLRAVAGVVLRHRQQTAAVARVAGVRLLSSSPSASLSSSRDDLASVLGEVRPRSSITNKLWRARNSITKEDAHKPSQVLTKTMADSYTEVCLPFSTDKLLQEEYLTYAGSIRVGKILEDLDALAGTIAYRHCDDTTHYGPLTIVTASVDRITLLKHCGKQVATFTMVARDPVTKSAYPVNKLKATTPEEEEIMKLGEHNKRVRKREREQSVHRQPPTEEERLIVHDLYLRSKDTTRKRPLDTLWMVDTQRQSMRMCHPIERNIHNSIFGGFIMREAFEIGWMTAVLAVKDHPFLLAVDDISFQHPVEIGSLLTFSSMITYAPGNDSRALQVDVRAEVISPTTGQSKVTNTFHFTFSAPHPTVPTVLPRTYEESMWYLDGRRRFLKSREECRQLCPDLLKYY
ncbi:hypothetical protein PTSG_11662 [Salpingoeca rosetta]|uniref:HotDog ACOT-type domain-containing protein n=1 Tax=Salpingoeca rosetta (strain ATCC 50818 / BSB-021) TaxID=946362 RepID=F2TXY5_SALR5|nr:uncharacterized protein PTSG_11662 [Salpingoeca rosetta]EGD76244.1 hypothetical protein PTSG_11662 [Salpingoeca rosetta]|eukprot:XP_004998419.1 hypothetical protein PTSG_11662 [Salpingoeca rosetta]